ncbi:MAG: hypothetical protein MO852_07860 [Candidatus Devosia euplotis]|nr:hypothetical protein [Candidatus Devosia euplotis]
MPGYTAQPFVKSLARDTPMGCWIAGLARIYNYKYPFPGKSQCQLSQEGGPDFERYYQTGLPTSGDPAVDKYPVLLNTYRMIDLPPQIYTLNGWMDLLQRYGPLAVIVDATAPNDRLNHLMILQGVHWTAGFSDAHFALVYIANGNSGDMTDPQFQRILDTPDAVDRTTMRGFAIP